MSTDLVHIQSSGEQSLAQQGGLGMSNLASRLLKLKPATININQPMTQAEGALPGHLRNSVTGAQFKSLDVVFLDLPVEWRDYHINPNPGSDMLYRTPENLMCFSRNMKAPHEDSKVPQSMRCANCAKGDWSKYRQTKSKSDIPPCQIYFRAILVDMVLKIPYVMYFRSKGKNYLEEGFEKLANELAMLKAAEKGRTPNIFDIRFKLGVKQDKKSKTPNYVINLSDFKAITLEEREELTEMFGQYTGNSGHSEEDEAADQMEAANQQINNEVSNTIEGELVDEIGL